MLRKIFVDGMTCLKRRSLETLDLPRGFPPIRIIHNTRMTFYRGTFSAFFPKNEDVRHNRCASTFKCCAGKTYCCDKISTFGEFRSRALTQLIHRSAGCNSSNQTTGTNIIDHLHEEVVMWQKSRTAVFWIARNRCISERYVPNGKIKAAIREARCFKPL